jgi:hypothetical protein
MTVRSGKNAGVAGAIVRGKECQEMDRLACTTTFVAVVERGGFAPPVHRGLQSLVESATTARTHKCPGAARSSLPLATPGREDIAMSSNLIEITGGEALACDGGPLDALIDFYRSFNARDLDGLTANWADGDAPSMDNPIGGIRRGWPAIRDGYSKLFNGPATVHVAFHDFTSQGGTDWHIFVGREKGVCRTPPASIDLRIRTTRWFIRTNDAWRQLHHHGSIEEPTLLANYQRAIFGAPLDRPA